MFAVLFCTGCIQDQRMMKYVEMQYLFDGILNVLNPGIAEFHNPVTFGANQVVMLLIAV